MNRTTGKIPEGYEKEKYEEQDGICSCCGKKMEFGKERETREWDLHHINGNSDDDEILNTTCIHRDCHFSYAHFKNTKKYLIKEEYIAGDIYDINIRKIYKLLPINIYNHLMSLSTYKQKKEILFFYNLRK